MRRAARSPACNHKLIDAAAMMSRNASTGWPCAGRLYRGNRRQSSMVDANALSALLEADGAPVDRGLLHNAFITASSCFPAPPTASSWPMSGG